jgi:hypothetical protein
MPKTLPMILQWDESFDIGSDTLTGVNDADYEPPFAFTGRLDKLTVKIDRPELSPADIQTVARRHPEAGSGHAQQQGERITSHFRGGEACAWGRRDGPESPA